MPAQSKPDSRRIWTAPESLLQVSPLDDEVHFWRQLIESMDPSSQPREYMERMYQALALAEYRLALQVANPGSNPSVGHPH